jgi:hypothetical protein
MGIKLDNYISETLCDIGLDWWKGKNEEFMSLPYLSSDKSFVEFNGEIEELHLGQDSTISKINVKFDFDAYVFCSEKCVEDLDTALQLTNTGSFDDEQFGALSGLNEVKRKIIKAITKIADKLPPSFDFKVFIDRTLALIKDELDENSGLVDDELYSKTLVRFYKELENEIFSKYKYEYDAGQSSSPPNYDRFPLKLNIEQLSALATYLSSVSGLTKNQRLDLFSHFSNVFEIWDKKKHKQVELKQIHASHRKIKMKKHEGAGLKEILNKTDELIDAINAGKINDFLDFD